MFCVDSAEKVELRLRKGECFGITTAARAALRHRKGECEQYRGRESVCVSQCGLSEAEEGSVTSHYTLPS